MKKNELKAIEAEAKRWLNKARLEASEKPKTLNGNEGFLSYGIYLVWLCERQGSSDLVVGELREFISGFGVRI